MKPDEPLPVKLICGILYSDWDRLKRADELISSIYGPLDYRSPVYPFDITDYYEAEMGTPISRVFYSYTRLVTPNRLAGIKIECNRIEDRLAVAGKRRVNIDAGYMDYDKFVLASAKYNAHKIYLDFGIYADLTLQFTRGRFVPSKWCFPDFKSGLYEETFLHIRAKYKGQIRKRLKK